MKTHYDNLRVTRTASPEVIKNAYRHLCQKHHPDKNQNDIEESERILKIINRAYGILSNPQRRKEYDVSLLRSGSVNKVMPEETQRKSAAEEAMFNAHAQTRRWATDEIRSGASKHAQQSMRGENLSSSLLTQVKFALTFLCMLCIFSWVAVMLLIT